MRVLRTVMVLRAESLSNVHVVHVMVAEQAQEERQLPACRKPLLMSVQEKFDAFLTHKEILRSVCTAKYSETSSDNLEFPALLPSDPARLDPALLDRAGSSSRVLEHDQLWSYVQISSFAASIPMRTALECFGL